MSEQIRFSRSAASIGFVYLLIAIYFVTLSQLPKYLALDPDPVFEDPHSLFISLGILAYVLGATGVLLAGIKFGWFSSGGTWKSVVLAIGKAVIAVVVWIGSTAVLQLILADMFPVLLSNLLAPIVAAGLLGWWLSSGHWMATNAIAALISMFVLLRLGTEIGPAPVLVLFALLTVYDAIAVYATGHMITLANGVRDIQIPIPMLFEFPLEDRSDAMADGGRSMARLGLGDIVIPGLLVVSSSVFVPASTINGWLTVPAVGAIAGAAVGLGTMFMLMSGDRAHAGLPPLFVGTVSGYLLAAWTSGVPLDVAIGVVS